MFSVAELHMLRYLIAVAQQVIPLTHESRRVADHMVPRVAAELSAARERSETGCDKTGLDHDDEIISTAEAAQIIGCSQRRVQQRIAAGDLVADRIGRTYFLHRRDIA